MTQNWFDNLARSLANTSDRRSFLRGIGITLGGLSMVTFGSTTADASPGCRDYCRSKGYRGRAFGQCMASCAQGETFGSCEVDADCFHTGCSGQLCASQDIITTCEFTCEYACYAEAECACLGKGCGFVVTRELRDCLKACEHPQGIPCGDAVCDPDTEFCCNESCSICAPLGGGCIQIVCTP